MAEALDYFKVICVNCLVYGWKQPPDESKLFRCSSCKFLSYCSKECQTEHWLKVHKHHCKYLAKKKEKKKNSHDPVSCPGCMKQAEIGLDQFSQADNPYLGCPWTINNVPSLPKPNRGNVAVLKYLQSFFDKLTFPGNEDSVVPLPFKLGEMSGQWQTKAEHTIFIMSQLLYKMKVTKHPVYTFIPEASKLVTMLNEMRQDMWLAYINQVPGNLYNAIAVSTGKTLDKNRKQASDIAKEVSAHKYQDQTVFRPWGTFRLLLNILYQYRADVVRQDAVSMTLPGISEDEKQLMVTSDQFNDMWGKVLANMDGCLAPFTDLMEILCDGDLHQVCTSCSQDIVVSDAGYDFREVPSIFQGALTKAYLCGELKCYNKVATQDHQLFVTCMKTSRLAGFENLCDYCFLVSSGKVHRCTRCLSKYYCGVECRDKDWMEVHKVVCKEGQERKIKDGQEVRKANGIENVEEFVNNLEKMNTTVE